jgi:hypothetical protein
MTTRPKMYLVRDEETDSQTWEDTPPKFSDRRYVVPASNELGQSYPLAFSIMLDETA